MSRQYFGERCYTIVFSFLLICNASMFFICVTTLAHGGWQIAFRRVPEAISAVVPIFGLIAIFILFYIVFGFNHDGHNAIYHWVNPGNDEILLKKKGLFKSNLFCDLDVVIYWVVELPGKANEKSFARE